MSAAAKRPPPRPQKRRPAPASSVPGLRSLLVLLFGGAVLLAVMPAVFLIAATGLVPLVIGYFFEPPARRGTLPCLAGFNLAGVMAVLGMLWRDGGTTAAARGLLNDPLVWLLMYGSAGLATVLLWLAPQFLGHLAELRAARQRAALEQAQQALAAEFGDEIASGR